MTKKKTEEIVIEPMLYQVAVAGVVCVLAVVSVTETVHLAGLIGKP